MKKTKALRAFYGDSRGLVSFSKAISVIQTGVKGIAMYCIIALKAWPCVKAFCDYWVIVLQDCSNASSVCLMSSGVCAKEVNPASKGEGAR